MIYRQRNETDGILIIARQGPLTADNFAALTAEVDPLSGRTGKLPGLMIEAPGILECRSDLRLTARESRCAPAPRRISVARTGTRGHTIGGPDDRRGPVRRGRAMSCPGAEPPAPHRRPPLNRVANGGSLPGTSEAGGKP
jgi:hypothetical protein